MADGAGQTNWFYSISANGAESLTRAGQWHTFVAQPLFRFVLLDWVFEYALWLYYFARTVRLPLQVVPTHPDGFGGLSFVSIGQTQFCLPAFAFSCAFCSVIGQMVKSGVAPIQSFANVGAAIVVLILVLFLAPLLMFTPTLVKAKRDAIFAYSNLCQQTCSAFTAKWLPTGLPGPISLLDSSASFSSNLSASKFGCVESTTVNGLIKRG
ncbi:hypothetical protein BH11CYA1_BH11CYA1_46570 [soil metagenome]